jgi:hypothetical protein
MRSMSRENQVIFHAQRYSTCGSHHVEAFTHLHMSQVLLMTHNNHVTLQSIYFK